MKYDKNYKQVIKAYQTLLSIGFSFISLLFLFSLINKNFNKTNSLEYKLLQGNELTTLLNRFNKNYKITHKENYYEINFNKHENLLLPFQESNFSIDIGVSYKIKILEKYSINFFNYKSLKNISVFEYSTKDISSDNALIEVESLKLLFYDSFYINFDDLVLCAMFGLIFTLGWNFIFDKNKIKISNFSTLPEIVQDRFESKIKTEKNFQPNHPNFQYFLLNLKEIFSKLDDITSNLSSNLPLNSKNEFIDGNYYEEKIKKIEKKEVKINNKPENNIEEPKIEQVEKQVEIIEGNLNQNFFSSRSCSMRQNDIQSADLKTNKDESHYTNANNISTFSKKKEFFSLNNTLEYKNTESNNSSKTGKFYNKCSVLSKDNSDKSEKSSFSFSKNKAENIINKVEKDHNIIIDHKVNESNSIKNKDDLNQENICSENIYNKNNKKLFKYENINIRNNYYNDNENYKVSNENFIFEITNKSNSENNIKEVKNTNSEDILKLLIFEVKLLKDIFLSKEEVSVFDFIVCSYQIENLSFLDSTLKSISSLIRKSSNIRDNLLTVLYEFYIKCLQSYIVS